MASLDELIDKLNSPKAGTRYDACEELRVATESSEAVIVALEKAAHDSDPYVAERAEAALNADVHRRMRIQLGRLAATSYEEFRQVGTDPKKPIGKVYTTRREKAEDFVIGFAGWFIANGLLWIIMLPRIGLYGSTMAFFLLGLVPLPANIIVLIRLAYRRQGIAFGMLAAFALNLIINTVFGLFVKASCFTVFIMQSLPFQPFFIPLLFPAFGIVIFWMNRWEQDSDR